MAEDAGTGGTVHAASAASSHLYRGALVRVEDAAGLVAMAMAIRFADGGEAAAEVLLGEGPAGGGVLDVAGHTTAAGTALPAKVWTIRDCERDGAALTLRLGAPLPPR
ncbi:hypothetical protein [Actinomadura verrucosospora]|uniref:Uncharacterized protein n=1 Tax=Actinomadura verrucosospora TaxID=46165 RepID=A0A7D3ZK80_ACTVE|nr:hypothetical protein [Actinomadura verrucosospora]QKG21981.1 hypothetical protein ACTIVE_3619 [Actinomadura verrucosospora]